MNADSTFVGQKTPECTVEGTENGSSDRNGASTPHPAHNGSRRSTLRRTDETPRQELNSVTPQVSGEKKNVDPGTEEEKMHKRSPKKSVEARHREPIRGSNVQPPSRRTLERRLSLQQSIQLFQSLDNTINRDYSPTTTPLRSNRSSISTASNPNPRPVQQPHSDRSHSMPSRYPARSSQSFPYAHPLHTSSESQLMPRIDDDEEPPTRPPPITVIDWTSAETRRKEYEKIDRAHSGLRGLWKKVMPKCCHHPRSRRGFFRGDCDGDSVRRFRLDLQDEIENENEKMGGDDPPQDRRQGNRSRRVWNCLSNED